MKKLISIILLITMLLSMSISFAELSIINLGISELSPELSENYYTALDKFGI